MPLHLMGNKDDIMGFVERAEAMAHQFSRTWY